MGTLEPQSTLSVTDAAWKRIRIFYQCVGLPEDRAEALTRAARENASPSLSAEDETSLAFATLADIMSAYEDWLQHLRDVEGNGVAPCPGLLGIQLRAILQRDPDGYLLRENLPAEMDRAIERSTQPPVPEEIPVDMPTQALGDLPIVFQGALWKIVAAKLKLVKGGVIRWTQRARRPQ